MNKKNYHTFLIAGGTGGHIFPALSFSDFLKSRGFSNVIITDDRGIKYFDKSEYENIKISASHLNKKNLNFIKSVFLLLKGFFEFILLLIRERPKQIISFGSYVAFSPLLASLIFKKIFNIKIYFHEQNSVIGKVHKIFYFSANKIFLTYEDTIGIKNNHKIIYSGFPARKKISEFKNNNFNNDVIKKTFNLFVFGGSQGSLNLSNMAINLIKSLPGETKKNIHLTIQVPKQYLEKFKKILDDIEINFEINSFYKDILLKLSKTDLCICRSGSSTINELISLKVPSILVPLPISSNNHQFYNAKFLDNLGSAILIEEKYFESDKTLEILSNMIKDKKLLKDMYFNLSNIKQLNSNKIIFEEIYN